MWYAQFPQGQVTYAFETKEAAEQGITMAVHALRFLFADSKYEHIQSRRTPLPDGRIEFMVTYGANHETRYKWILVEIPES